MSKIPKSFDWLYYINSHQDLLNAGIKTKSDAIKHYLNYGKYENRKYFNKEINKGVNVIGYGNSNTGLGHNMRIIISSLEIAKIPYTVKIISLPNENTIYLKDSESYNYNINIIAINPDHGYEMIKNQMKNKYNIVLWAWELEVLPIKWKKDSKLFDEIWTISKFCENTFKKELPDKIIKKINIQGNFGVKKDKEICKKELNLQNKFIVIFIFDGNSGYRRKNYDAVIEVFNKSLSKNDDCILIIKSHNNNYCNKEFEFNKNIIIINKNYKKEEMDILFNSADVYVSLHKSEGSGLTIMEAIDLEIPVLCTNYSGNLDFCDENCQLVDYNMIKVDDPIYIHLLNGLEAYWAEPDIDDAVNKLLDIYNNYNYFKDKILKTKKKIHENYSIEKLSEFFKNFI